jgi:hypothetical protein
VGCKEEEKNTAQPRVRKREGRGEKSVSVITLADFLSLSDGTNEQRALNQLYSEIAA